MATLPGLPANAVIYEEEVSRPPDSFPKFVPEFVMAQLESDANLARLRNPTVRHLVIVLMETGIRGGDASVLPSTRSSSTAREVVSAFREREGED